MKCLIILNNVFVKASFVTLTFLFFPSQGKEAVQVNNDLQLLWDYALIDEVHGDVEVVAHKPNKKELVLVLDKPWEGRVSAYVTIIKDKIYKMYYRCADIKNGKIRHDVNTCYAESDDGINWKRPSLGLVAFKGQDTNIILKGDDNGITHNFTPFLDTKVNVSKHAKYKATGWHRTKSDAQLYLYQSGDGINWTVSEDKALKLKGAFDSQNVTFYDDSSDEYKLYYREYTKGERFKDGIRTVALSSSHDLNSWSSPKLLKYYSLKGEILPDVHLYTSQIQPYFRNPHVYIGFPSRLFPKKRDALLEPVFIFSRNGIEFTRFEESIIRPGLNPTAWSNRSNFVWLGVVETASDVSGINELSIYGNESYNQEGAPTKIRRYTYRIDGFASLQASFQGGGVVTKPMVFKGEYLSVNYSTSAAGAMEIQVLDESGNLIQGFDSEIYGDKLDETIEWSSQKSLKNLEGKVIRLKFTLRDANLYSFKFTQ